MFWYNLDMKIDELLAQPDYIIDVVPVYDGKNNLITYKFVINGNDIDKIDIDKIKDPKIKQILKQ